MTLNMYTTINANRVNFNVNYNEAFTTIRPDTQNLEVVIQDVRVYKNRLWGKILCFLGMHLQCKLELKKS